jgi:hypothetical protein
MVRIVSSSFKLRNVCFQKIVPLSSVEVPNGCVNFMSTNSSPSGRVKSAGLPSSDDSLPASQNKNSKQVSLAFKLIKLY